MIQFVRDISEILDLMEVEVEYSYFRQINNNKKKRPLISYLYIINYLHSRISKLSSTIYKRDQLISIKTKDLTCIVLSLIDG